MGTETQAPDLASLNRIRVETALSRFPIHRLSRKGSTVINFTNEDGLQWRVSYNTEHGEPGPHAYKLDTLIINRRIDEAQRPLPEIIRLGTLREINRELGVAEDDTQTVKRALLQNASAFISAKIRYRQKNTKDGRQKKLEIHHTRYSVVFNGELLPDKTTADAVYIVLNPLHRALLNDAEVRPLDYDYLMSLTPGAQRLYELLSFQIYGAIAGERSRARLTYSEYCMSAPQVRYYTFDEIKKQMFKLHAPHRKSGYIVKVEYEEVLDGQGRQDWEMLYTPGPKALSEYEVFARRPARRQQDGGSSSISSSTSQPQIPSDTQQSGVAYDPALVLALSRRGVAEKTARELLAHLRPGQDVISQIEYFDHVIAKAPEGKFHSPPGFLVKFIEQNLPVPETFQTSRKKREGQQFREAKATAHASRSQLQQEYERFRDTEVARFVREELPVEEYQALYEQNRHVYSNLLKATPAPEIDKLADAGVRAELKRSGRVPIPTFEDYCCQQQGGAQASA